MSQLEDIIKENEINARQQRQRSLVMMSQHGVESFESDTRGETCSADYSPAGHG
jgi:hypothetical protein